MWTVVGRRDTKIFILLLLLFCPFCEAPPPAPKFLTGSRHPRAHASQNERDSEATKMLSPSSECHHFLYPGRLVKTAGNLAQASLSNIIQPDNTKNQINW